MKSFAKTLLDSNLDAVAFGPTIDKPSALKWSTMPSARGASGPMKVRSILSVRTKLARPVRSETGIGTNLASAPIPALPGAQ